MIFDATSLPANGSTPLAVMPVGIGVSNSPTENERTFTPNYLSVAVGVYYAWSTTPVTLTIAGSGTGLTVEGYGF